jgi:hypothetical protein
MCTVISNRLYGQVKYNKECTKYMWVKNVATKVGGFGRRGLGGGGGGEKAGSLRD